MSARQLEDTDKIEALQARADEHPPPWRLVAYVWWCGDDYCDCGVARVDARRPQATDPRWSDIETLWSGTFRTDGEWWSPEPGKGASAELNRLARDLRKVDPELRRRIEWPWDRSKLGEVNER